jgi:putative ABC transport system substrate-binding protein
MKKAAIPPFVVAAVLLAAAVIAEAQQPKNFFRIGYLSSSEPGRATRAQGIQQRLSELGYIEGQNITIEYRYGEGKFDRAPELAAELVRLKPDVIVVSGGTRWVEAVKTATKTIPIVMTGAGSDPIEVDIVESLARPGGNVTGIIGLSTELGGKRLELLKDAVPKVARVAVLYNPDLTSNVGELKAIQSVAHSLKLTIQRWAVRDAEGFEKVFAAMGKQRPDGIYVLQGQLMALNRKRITDFALKNQLPSMYINRQFAQAGGLMSYGRDTADNYQRVAYYVDKILKGAKPADLPVEQPTKFELVINLNTAKQIGVTIPQSVLYRADKVIK